MRIRPFISLALLCLCVSAWAQNTTPELIKAGQTLEITTTEPGVIRIISSGDTNLHFTMVRVPQLGDSMHFRYLPQLRVTVVVRNDGKINMPLLGDVPADGLTVAEFTQIMEGRLQKYLNTPRVIVQIVK